MMKLIIAGSRTLNPSIEYLQRLVTYFNLTPTEIVCGKAEGVDTCGENFAKSVGLPVQPFPYLSKHGRRGGWYRNLQMGFYADALLLIWTGTSRGSKMMKKIMNTQLKPVYEIVVSYEEEKEAKRVRHNQRSKN